jgi:F-type H+-transporting ATPase subunit b
MPGETPEAALLGWKGEVGNRMLVLSSGALIDLDGTLLVLMGVFFITLLVLRAFVFRPMIALFEAREEAIDGARAEARRMDAEARQAGDKFEEEMRRLRGTAATDRERLRQEGLRLERTILAKVQAETRKELTDAEAHVQGEARRLRADIRVAVPKLAGQIAGKLLGREVA